MREFISRKSSEDENIENVEGDIRYRVRWREIKERLPPDFDKRYIIIGEYRQGDGKRAVLPLILEHERRRYLGFLLSLLVLHFLLLLIVSLNIFALSQLARAQASVQALLANDSRSNWVAVKEVGRFSDGTRLVEVSFSFRIPVLDRFLLVRRTYLMVRGES